MGLEPRHPEPGTRNLEPGTQNPALETRRWFSNVAMVLGAGHLKLHPKPETRTPKPETRNPEHGIRNSEPGAPLLLLLQTVEIEGFVRSEFRTLRNQICGTQGPKVNCVRQVDL